MGLRTPRDGRSSARRLAVRLIDLTLILALGGFCLIFVVWPIASFLWQGVGPGVRVAWEALRDNAGLLANSAFVGVLASLLSCVLALGVAMVMTFGPRAWARVLGGLVTVSLISPPFVASLAYIELFGRRGLVTHGLLGLSVSPYGWQGVVLMQSLFFAAINVALLTSVLKRVDRAAVLAALDLGAGNGRVVLDVVVPLVRPATLVCLLLTFVRSVSDYATPVVVGGKFETVATQIYLRVVGYSDFGTAAVLNVLLFVVSALAFVAYRRFEARGGAQSLSLGEGVRTAEDEAGLRLRGPLGIGCQVVGLLYAGFLALIYAAIVRSAFTKGMGWDAAFTTEYLSHLLEFDLASVGRSMAYAACAAALSCILGLLAAYYAHRRRVRGSAVVDFLTTVPYTLPGICLGLGFILAFNAKPLELVGTATIIVVVLVSKELAVSTRAFTAALSQIPDDLDHAAADLGASAPETLATVLLPNLRDAAGVSLVNGFSSGMVSYSAVLFLVTPGHKTAVLELFDALSGGKYGEAAMVSLTIIAITSVVNLLFYRLLLRRGR